ncbi:MAG: TRAP transporter small permease, partial [Betaproteobacteria bacterium]
MQKLLALVDRLLHFLLITTLLLLIVPVSLQIFSRFTDLIPRYMWTEEISRFCYLGLKKSGGNPGVCEPMEL